MKKDVRHRLDLELRPKEIHVYGMGVSYLRDNEELIRQLVGAVFPRIDEVSIRIGRKIYDDYEVSYKNTSEFIMHSF